MRRTWQFVPTLLLGLLSAWPLLAQQMVDRIAARVENDIILLSDVRELSRYQQFVDGASESDERILDRLIDQWIVRNEAAASRFPHPSEADVTRSMERLKKSFSTPEEFESRKKRNGVSEEDVRRMVESQLYLSNYLDSRFRSSIQVDSKAVEEFYQSKVVQRAQVRGQAPPSLDAAHDYIQEFLVQQAINEHADQWLKESHARLRVERLLNAGSP
jgi:parvulin-like peptidyl-prolyl isomerase